MCAPVGYRRRSRGRDRPRRGRRPGDHRQPDPRRGQTSPPGRRAGGQYHFNVGYQLACPHESFTVWLSPHPGRDEIDTRRPENLRVIPTGDPDADRLAGIRSDAESFHSNYKRTLLVDRAMSLGWRRGLVDLYCFALYNNALTEHRATEQAATVSGSADGHDRPRLTPALVRSTRRSPTRVDPQRPPTPQPRLLPSRRRPCPNTLRTDDAAPIAALDHSPTIPLAPLNSGRRCPPAV